MNSSEFETLFHELTDKIDAMHEQQQTLMQNQRALAEELGAASEKVDAIAEADGGSQQTTDLADEELIEQLAQEVGRDNRSAAKVFGADSYF